jgi:hypothetical protein
LGLLTLLLAACGDDGGGGAPTSPASPIKAWGAPTLIETDNTGHALGPGPQSVAFDAAGNALVVWMQFDGTYNIWANRYSTSTGLWGAAAPIETDTGDAPHPQVAIDAAGNALVVWRQFDGTHYNIWANRYSASTGLWGAAAPIETDSTGDAFVPQVAIDATGNALAVWTQFDGTRNNIWANRYSASTGLWGVAAPIETDTGDASHPQVAIDATGNGLAVWTQFDGTNYSILANRYSASTGWGVAAPIETGNAESASDPQVAINATGNALAVWQQFNGPFGNIWANRYSASTGLWGVATPIDNNNPEAASNPQVAIDAAGNGLAVWIQSDGPHNTIWANRYSANTGLWGVAGRIENLMGDADAPQIAIDATGNALVVWRQFNNNRGSIRANRYSASTGLWGVAAPIETNEGDAGGADVAIDATGNALVVWNQSDGPVSSTLLSMWANRLRCREVGWVGRTPPCELGK